MIFMVELWGCFLAGFLLDALRVFSCGILAGFWDPFLCAFLFGKLAPANPLTQPRFGVFRSSSSSWPRRPRFAILFGGEVAHEVTHLPRSSTTIHVVNREIGWWEVEGWPAATFSRWGGLTALGHPGQRFCFAGFSSVSLFAMTRGAFWWNTGSFWSCLQGVCWWWFLLGTWGSTAPGRQSKRPSLVGWSSCFRQDFLVASLALTIGSCGWNHGEFWSFEECFQWFSWLLGASGLTATQIRSNHPY
jgi:hypothetical protein